MCCFPYMMFLCVISCVDHDFHLQGKMLSCDLKQDYFVGLVTRLLVLRNRIVVFPVPQ